MIQKLATQFALDPPKELRALMKLMGVIFDPVEYPKLLQAQISDFAQRQSLLTRGFFSTQDLWSLLLGCGCPGGVKSSPVSVLLDRLIEWGLVSKLDLPNALAPLMWEKERIAYFVKLGVIDNILLGLVFIAQKYRQSVPSIVVLKDEVEQVGTGFVVRSEVNNKLFVVTAKHNIDSAERIEFVRFGQADDIQYEAIDSKWAMHPSRDIAAMEVRVTNELPPTQLPVTISLRGHGHMLSRTVTLGYPIVSSSDRSYLLAHNGELNAIITSYLDKEKYLLISNFVGPGNSGSPVLDEAGICVGMVVRAFEGEYEGGINKVNAAIPAIELLRFVNGLV